MTSSLGVGLTDLPTKAGARGQLPPSLEGPVGLPGSTPELGLGMAALPGILKAVQTQLLAFECRFKIASGSKKENKIQVVTAPRNRSLTGLE